MSQTLKKTRWEIHMSKTSLDTVFIEEFCRNQVIEEFLLNLKLMVQVDDLQLWRLFPSDQFWSISWMLFFRWFVTFYHGKITMWIPFRDIFTQGKS